jgi:hypothetical protein
MIKTCLFALFMAAAGTLAADPLDLVTLNTSSLNGTTGSIDFLFDPGSNAQAATIQILEFTGATYISASQQPTGAVSGGPVPSTITINNTDADNDMFDAVTFGKSLSFLVSFSGPAVTAPNGEANNESTFDFSVFTDEAGTVPASSLTSDPNGVVAAITLNAEGNTVFNAVSPEAQISAVPEPRGVFLLGTVMLGLAVVNWCGRR